MSEMLIETFEDTELLESCETEAQQAERAELCSKLNLTGQTEIPAVPFEPMSQETIRVYQTLLPVKESLREYSRSAVPLRVLQTIDRFLHLFPKLEVWHDGKGDPIVVGYTTESWNAQPHLIARWGAELVDFPTLRERAITRKVEQERAKCQEYLDTAASRTRAFMFGSREHMFS